MFGRFLCFFLLNFVLNSFVSTSNDVIFTFLTSFNNRSRPQQSCAEPTNPPFATLFPRARRFFLPRETKDQRLRINAIVFRPQTQKLKPRCQTSSFALGMKGFMTQLSRKGKFATALRLRKTHYDYYSNK